jgi:phosphoribosyl 1,2-cyclic phosphate phosphodiesterase
VRLTFLGTGTSFGVPQIGCGCAVCRSSDPRDHRSRVGALVESDDGARILIDTPPELRLQLLAAGVDRVDAVLYTHDHADHTHGIDDLRAMTRTRGSIPIYGSAETLASIERKFVYIFDDSPPPPGSSKPEGRGTVLQAGVTVHIAGVPVTPVAVPHGRLTVFGYRIGDVAYVTDAKEIPAEARRLLQGTKLLVINALFDRPHPTHLSIPEAVRVAQELGVERTYLTHLTHDHAHADLEASLPPGVRPAYDGLTVAV